MTRKKAIEALSQKAVIVRVENKTTFDVYRDKNQDEKIGRLSKENGEYILKHWCILNEYYLCYELNEPGRILCNIRWHIETQVR